MPGMTAAEANLMCWNFMTEDAVFIGTDAKRDWNKTISWAFKTDKGKAWRFYTPLRNGMLFILIWKTAWFDELPEHIRNLQRLQGIGKNRQGLIKTHCVHDRS
jgi:hypothetical protein